jgi:hypothetical protein
MCSPIGWYARGLCISARIALSLGSIFEPESLRGKRPSTFVRGPLHVSLGSGGPLMHPIIRVVVSPWCCASAILLVGAVRAPAQERPAGPAGSASAPASAARGWSGYRPGAAWTGRTPAGASAGSSAEQRRAAAASRGAQANVYASRPGWATYAPSTAWTGYRPGVAWRGNTQAPARPRDMTKARVPGPSPYADGLARSYHEYGTGRPVPLSKPWLPGSP